MRHQLQNEPRSFNEVVESEMAHISEHGVHQRGGGGYLSRGLYTPQIESLMSTFRRDQILFLKYEDFRANNAQAMKSVFSFLGLDTPPLIENLKSNVIPYSSVISEGMRARLVKYYKEDVLKLERLLGWDCADWRD